MSPSGEHVASGATDGTVKIWAPPELGGGAMGKKRETTFQAGGPVLSLDWDRYRHRSIHHLLARGSGRLQGVMGGREALG